ncbi:hypothetical protein N7476_006662 [Penicillium atrosanguineum]|uniref:Uncharacterized protein n=1 Tax=Penicillium atrosanguineum TaxID=1132637 RepID=A0A9W9U6Q7_9EURO|nr:hypothetical protein N7476_006662 [Penicillium atrosanguineum]
MSDLLSSRWAPSASESYSHHSQNHTPRRPRSENRIRSNPSPTRRNDNNKRTPTPTITPNPNTLLPPSEELNRFMKIVARLRWKLPFLAEGYRLATLDAGMASESQSEIMFKIDFHEYYALLERAIVHLLGVFNITVSSRARGFASGSVHRYHANVLHALEQETSPLTPILGSGRVYLLLRKAKELRNRWKTADMTVEERENDPWERKEVVPLKEFDFEDILSGIFGGLEEAYVRAREHVELCRRPGEEGGEEDGEEDWRFMVEGMDWEAV